MRCARPTEKGLCTLISTPGREAVVALQKRFRWKVKSGRGEQGGEARLADIIRLPI